MCMARSDGVSESVAGGVSLAGAGGDAVALGGAAPPQATTSGSTSKHGRARPGSIVPEASALSLPAREKIEPDL